MRLTINILAIVILVLYALVLFSYLCLESLRGNIFPTAERKTTAPHSRSPLIRNDKTRFVRLQAIRAILTHEKFALIVYKKRSIQLLSPVACKPSEWAEMADTLEDLARMEANEQQASKILQDITKDHR